MGPVLPGDERTLVASPPPPERIGPCRLERALGSGGMGAVWLATLAEDRPYGPAGTRVAIKVLYPDRIGLGAGLERLRLEAELGMRVAHPGLVRVHEAGSVRRPGGDHHFLVMEFVEGQTLRQLRQVLGVLPEPLVRDLGCQIAGALDALHRAGAVHRDIKPTNVLITPENQVKVMDLGVAILLEESTRLTVDGHFVGTAQFGSPEQFRGERPGPAADLYALGVLLFELATGVNPFAGGGPAEVMGRHLNLVPPCASRLNPRLSPLLDELLAALLLKDAAARPAPAVLVAEILARGEASSWWRERERPRRASRRGVRPARGPGSSPLVGRDAELAVLESLWAEARAGRGSLVLLEGEAGIGKSRLLAELLASVDGRGEPATVLLGTSPPAGWGSAGPFAEAVLAHLGDAGLASAIERLLGRTPDLVPALLAHLTGRTAPAGPAAAETLAAAFTAFLRAVASEAPVLWAVEDLHFAPAESRALLLALGRIVAHEPVLLVATTRPGLEAAELDALLRGAHARRIALDRLAPEPVRALARAVDERLPERVIERIVARSDGNPFFALALLAQARERGEEPASVPGSVRDLLEVRLAGLDGRERELLDVAAVQGFAFDPDLVARVGSRPRLEVLRGFAELERRTRLVHGTAEGFEFDHHQLHELVRDRLPPPLAREYHALTAEAFAARAGLAGGGAAATPEQAVFLAEHYLAGGRSEGLAWLEPALQALEARFHGEAAIALAELGLGVLGSSEPERRARMRLLTAAALSRLGRRDEQRAAVEQAQRLAREAGSAELEARAAGELVKLHIDLSAFEAALGAAEAGRALAAAAGDRRLEARLLGQLGIACHRLGRFDEALAAQATSAELAERLGDAPARMQALNNRGNVFMDLGRYEQARECFAAVEALAAATGDRVAEATAAGNAGITWRRSGDYSRARERFTRDLDLSRAAGYRIGEARATGNLGVVLRAAGERDAARACFERHRRLAREIGHRLGEAVAIGNLGVVEFDFGRLAAARACFEEALGQWRAIGVAHGELTTLALLARLECDLGRIAEAARLAAEVRDRARLAGLREIEIAALRRLGEAARLRGALGQAGEELGSALELARELGSRESVATLLFEIGRIEAERGHRDAALAALAEAAERSRDQDWAECGPLPAAWLAAIGAADPSQVAIERRAAILVQLEAHAVVASAGGGAGHAQAARSLFAGIAAGLGPDLRPAFVEGSPSARLLRRLAV